MFVCLGIVWFTPIAIDLEQQPLNLEALSWSMLNQQWLSQVLHGAALPPKAGEVQACANEIKRRQTPALIY